MDRDLASGNGAGFADDGSPVAPANGWGPLYRLPWSLPDNPIGWLEPTSKCNLACEGCYRLNDPTGHKPLDVVRRELEVFRRHRNPDGISIAGGDPLVHPDVVEIVRTAARMGFKPILNTNGLGLDAPRIRELRRAGAVGFTFHVDGRQGRPGWKDKTEAEMNDLRTELAELVAGVGGLACSFNSTVYPDTIEGVPDIVAWAQRRIDIVHAIVFIAFREGTLDGSYDYVLSGRRIDARDLPYIVPRPPARAISSDEIAAVIHARFPDFRPCAYLNGTARPDSRKWLLSVRLGVPGRVYGYAGPRLLELIQAGYHFLKGRYLAYTHPRYLGMGRSMMTLLSPIDRGVRRCAAAWAGDVLLRPWRLFRRVHSQSIMIIQPIDLLADGRQDMCDSCPDMTVWDGRLVWSCRLEELRLFGGFVQTVPVERVAANRAGAPTPL